MNDILKSFLEVGEKALQTEPFDFFPEPDLSTGNAGILPLYYLRWSASRGLILNGDEVLKSVLAQTDFAGKVLAIRRLLGDALRPAHYTEAGNEFSQKYYRPGGKYFYLSDFGAAFPDCEKFEDIPDNEINYGKIESILDERLSEWKNLKA
ncbi:hypothetical protein ACSEQ4_30830 [Pseudomonas aeruginosa]